MRNRWMQIIPSQSSTQKFIICKFAGFQIKRDRTSERVSSCQNCLKISHRRTFSFCMTKKCGIYGYNCIIKGSLAKNQWWTSSEFYYWGNAIPYFHTFKLNLIKSVIYIYIGNLFYILYFKQYWLQFYNKWLT